MTKEKAEAIIAEWLDQEPAFVDTSLGFEDVVLDGMFNLRKLAEMLAAE